ncbi:hypothetical protein P692DRAFT_201792853, partial [Suillus brevipes Sb2]
MNQHCIKPFSTPEVYRYNIGKVVKRAPNNVHPQRGILIASAVMLSRSVRESRLSWEHRYAAVSSSVMGTTSTRQFMGLGCAVGMIQRGLL